MDVVVHMIPGCLRKRKRNSTGAIYFEAFLVDMLAPDGWGMVHAY